MGAAAEGDTVVAAKLDRMFRSASNCLAVMEKLKARRVSLYLLDLNGGADDVSGNGIARLFLTIVSIFAEFERDLIDERIRRAKRAQKTRGEFLSGVPPFGWTFDADRKLVPVVEQQAVIEQISQLRSDGLSLRAIAVRLAEQGVRLSHNGVRRTLATAARRAEVRFATWRLPRKLPRFWPSLHVVAMATAIRAWYRPLPTATGLHRVA